MLGARGHRECAAREAVLVTGDRRRGGSISLLVALAALIALALPSAAGARVLLVGSWHGHRGSFASIQAAVDAARRGDWVLVGPGDYHERGDRDRRYRSLSEQGAGWVRFAPESIDRFALDRAESWFQFAWRSEG